MTVQVSEYSEYAPLPPFSSTNNGHLQKALAIWARPSGLCHVTGSKGKDRSPVTWEGLKGRFQRKAHRAAELTHTLPHAVHPNLMKRPGVKLVRSQGKDQQ